MASQNLYQDLKDKLNDFKTFMDANTDKIKPAINALKAIVPQVGDLVKKLVDLMNKLKTGIQNLDLKNLPGLPADGIATLSTFTTTAKTLLQTAEGLLPDEKSSIDEVLGVVDVVSGLPSLDTVKQDILKLIDDIITDLNKLVTA
jgi:septation ring formation regulator EzrA